jgi:uncharacterized protein (TIRG00374 family)
MWDRYIIGLKGRKFMKKKVISGLFIILFTITTAYMMLTSKELLALSQMIGLVDFRYIILGVLCLVGYLIINTHIIYTISKEVTTRLRWRDALFMTFVEQYYSLVTPFASGGQPAQILYMRGKYGISGTKGTTICIKKLLIYQVTVSIFATIMFLIGHNYIMSKSIGLVIVVIIGLLINVLLGVGIILMAYQVNLIKSILKKFLIIAHKFRILKKVSCESLNLHIDEYVKDLEEIRSNRGLMLRLFLLTLGQLTLYFIVPIFVYYALGETTLKPLVIIPIQTVVYVVACIIPTPGSAGAAEGSYYLLFKSIVSHDILVYSMALWRIIVYYMNMIISGIVVLAEKIGSSFNKKEKSIEG